MKSPWNHHFPMVFLWLFYGHEFEAATTTLTTLTSLEAARSSTRARAAKPFTWARSFSSRYALDILHTQKMCAYISMYIIQLYIYILIHLFIYLSIYLFIYIHVDMNAYICMYIYIYKRVWVRVCVIERDLDWYRYFGGFLTPRALDLRI